MQAVLIFGTRVVVAIGLCLTISACSNQYGTEPADGSFFAPRIISSNERSVSVEIMVIHNESDALKVAEDWCNKYQRHAVLVQDRKGGKFNYSCVE